MSLEKISIRTARTVAYLALWLAIPNSLCAEGTGSNQNATDQPATVNAADLTLEQLANVEIYSASKCLQRASDAPSSTTVVTKDEIERYGYRNLADILRAVRGFYITSDRNYSYVGVRGFGRLGDWNGRVLVLIDGHRINNNVFDQAEIGQEFPLDVDLIERVEIVRGPGSSLYGGSAFFAVINVITRDVGQAKDWETGFESGSFGTYKGRLSYGGALRDADILLSGTVFRSDGQNLFFPEFNTPAHNYGWAMNADGLTYLHTLAELKWHGLSVQVLSSQRDKHVPTAPFRNKFNDPTYHVVDHQEYADIKYEHDLAGTWRMFAQTSWDRFGLSTPKNALAPGGGARRDRIVAQGDWWTGDIRLTRTLLRKHEISLGSEVRDNVRARQTYRSTVLAANREVDVPSSIAAFYGQDLFSITSNLALNAGVRYDHYSSVGGTVNPRLALIYHARSKTSLKLLYGTAFRAPNPSEIDPLAGTIYAPNPSLAPETIRGIEGVIEQELGRHFSLTGSVFQNRISSLITAQFDPALGKLMNRNSDKAVATGTEIEFRAGSVSGLQATTSFIYTDADDGSSEDLSLTNSPRHVAKVNLSAPFAHKQLLAGIEAQYLGQRSTLAGHPLGGYPVFNVTLLGHTWGKHVDVSGSVYNLLDRKYSDPGRPAMVEDSLQQDGRNFRLKATFRF